MTPEEALDQIKGLVEIVGEIEADVEAFGVLRESVRRMREMEKSRDLFSPILPQGQSHD